MSFIFKFAKTIKNNWKKSVLLGVVTVYGYKYGEKKFSESLLRRAYCREAEVYGNQPIKTGELNRRITIFLNPAASGGSAKSLFEKHAAPILHMAGISITVVKTEYEGQAKEYMKVIENTDAIIIAGGDATVSDVVTGLLRNIGEKDKCRMPIGIIPVGKTNHIARKLFGEPTDNVRSICDAAMAIVKGHTKDVDVFSIKGDTESKNAYALADIEWGSFRDTKNKFSNYWYFGPLKEYVSYIINSLNGPPQPIEASLSTCNACEGCSKCYVISVKPKAKWWNIFSPKQIPVETKDYSQVINDDCGNWRSQEMKSSQFIASTLNGTDQEHGTGILKTYKICSTRKEFISEGWRQIKEDCDNEDINVESVGEFKLVPQSLEDDKGEWFTIDNEQYEAMSINVKLLKDKISVFTVV